MKFEVIDNCPVPVHLAPVIHEIKRRTGATLNSCDRSPEAEPFLKRCKPAKMSQRELYEGFRLGKPGFNPANAPGLSTHERRNDGVAYPGPAKFPLPYWCVGMDWENADGVIEAAGRLGFTAARTYPLSAREQHHLNFRKEPKLNLLKPLRLGDKGFRVARMAKQLASITDGEGRRYLERGQGVFDATLEAALRRFQADWDQDVDGVYGVQSSRQLAVALRAQQEKQKRPVATKPLRLGSKGPRVARIAKDLASITDSEGKRYLERGQGIFDATLESALRRFQADTGQDVDGVFGVQTARQLALAVRVEEEKLKPKPAAPTALSKEGATLIAAFEGFRSQLYNDAANHCTIGYGHLVHHGPIDGSEPAELKAGISQERALELLQEDAAKAASEIKVCVKVPLSQCQFDALVSFAFNVGNGAFRESTLLRLLNEGRYDAVEAQLARWNKAGGKTLQGLVNRRAAEAKFFNGT
ncbi:MAG: glycoside hydrolase family protein [Actinobacteria bacterium]|nr:glycoside hydrolase family protein [Actinomycetota bacterium]